MDTLARAIIQTLNLLPEPFQVTFFRDNAKRATVISIRGEHKEKLVDGRWTIDDRALLIGIECPFSEALRGQVQTILNAISAIDAQILPESQAEPIDIGEHFPSDTGVDLKIIPDSEIDPGG